MSGGSYDYLYTKDAAELDPDDPNLQHMIDRLEDIEYAPTAVAWSRFVQQKLREIRGQLREVDALLEQLNPVWHAVEWRDSCDWSDDLMRAAVIKYESAPHYGRVIVHWRADDTVVVEHADDVIGVLAEFLPRLADGPHLTADGVLVVDSAGEYRYRRVGEIAQAGVIVFERIRP